MLTNLYNSRRSRLFLTSGNLSLKAERIIASKLESIESILLFFKTKLSEKSTSNEIYVCENAETPCERTLKKNITRNIIPTDKALNPKY